MKFAIAFVTLLSTLFVGCISCDENERTLAQVCSEESGAKKAYDEHLGNGYDKDGLFLDYLKLRKERIGLAKGLKIADCSEVAQNDERIIVLKDEQVLNQLCLDEKGLDRYTKANEANKSLHTRLQKMTRQIRWRQQQLFDEMNGNTKEKFACSPVDESSIPDYSDLGPKLMDFFHDNCKQEAIYNYIKRKIPQVSSEIKSNELEPLGLEAANKYDDVKYGRLEFCPGNFEECCGEELIEEAVGEAILRIAQESLDLAEEMVESEHDKFELKKKERDWNDKFNRVCVLEYQTKDNQFYPARESTLKTLNVRAKNARVALEAVLDKKTCPQDATDFLEPINKIAEPIDIDPRCEEEVKSKFLCRSYADAYSSHTFNYLDRELRRLRDSWCLKNTKIQVARTSVLKVYKPPNCSDQSRAQLNDDAAVEATVTLELLETEWAIAEAKVAKKSLVAGLKDQYRFLSKIRKICKKELDTTNNVRKEQSQKALEIIDEKLEKLEVREELKGSKFDLLKPKTWSY